MQIFGRPDLLGIAAAGLLAAGLFTSPSWAQANLCQELQSYVEKKASEPPKEDDSQASATPQIRKDGEASGTQGGGSTAPKSSNNTSAQSSPPPTAPASSGSAPEPANSPHATDGYETNVAASHQFPGGATLSEMRKISGGSDRQACREAAQKLRRAGADMPAALIALSAYEPKR